MQIFFFHLKKFTPCNKKDKKIAFFQENTNW